MNVDEQIEEYDVSRGEWQLWYRLHKYLGTVPANWTFGAVVVVLKHVLPKHTQLTYIKAYHMESLDVFREAWLRLWGIVAENWRRLQDFMPCTQIWNMVVVAKLILEPELRPLHL